MSEAYRILAVDPGVGRVGIAILEKKNGKELLLYSACIQTAAGGGQSKRLALVRERIEKILKDYGPEALAIEALYFSKNKKTALTVAEGRGVILSAVGALGLEIFEYQPSQIKVAVTGHGASDKRQVQEMVRRILKIDDEKRLDDEYDAIAIGLTHLAVHR